MLGNIFQEPDVLLRYLGTLHSHLSGQVMLFKPRTIDEACVQVQCLVMEKFVLFFLDHNLVYSNSEEEYE